MRVCSIGSNYPKHNVNFGFNVYGDCGASIPEASIKRRLESRDKSKTFVIKDGVVCPNGINGAQGFLGGIADNIATIVRQNIYNLPEDDRFLDNVAIFVPAQSQNNKVKIISNLRDSSTKAQLRDIDFNHIQGMLTARGVKVSDHFKLVVANDMYGAVAGVLNEVLQNEDKYGDLLTKGSKNLIVMPGGGLGVGMFEVDRGRIRIIAEESGHVVSKAKGKTFEADGASVPALIGNFAKSLRLSELDKEKLVKTGNAKIATQYPVWMEDNSEEYHKLMDTGLFEHKETKDGNAYLVIKKDGSAITQEEFNKASKYSVGKFVDDIARLCAIKINSKAKSALLTGKLIDKINKDISHNPAYHGKNIEQMITARIPAYLDPVGVSLAEVKKFKVIYMKMEDNTGGGSLILNGEQVGENDWMDIPYTNKD